jgi:hypothetical protein
LYTKEKSSGEIPSTIRKILLAFRTVGVSLVCLLLTNLFLKRVINKTEKPMILLAIDNSSSITGTKDSSLLKQNLITEIKKLSSDLLANFEVNTLLFGEKTRSSDSITFQDKETDLSNLFTDITNNYSGVNIGALVLFSDGIYNKGTNPLYAIDKSKYPIYTVAMGDTISKKDVLIQKIIHNQVAYLGNQFSSEVTINAIKYSGEDCKVSLYKNNVKKAEQSIRFNSQNHISTLNFISEADAPGIQKYTVVVDPLEGETNRINNTQSFIIDVIDNRDKILLVANSPHPDIAAISDCIESMKNYELTIDVNEYTARSLKPYSLVIIHGYSSNHSKLLNECIANQIPYFHVNPSLKMELEEVKIKNTIDRLNDAEAAINSAFNLFTLSDAVKNTIKQFPAVKTPFGKYVTLTGAQVLLQQQIGAVTTGDPILLFNESKGIKSAIFIGDGLWRWKLRDFQENKNFNCFNELLSKSIQFLSVKSDKSFFRLSTQKVINENEAIEFSAELYNRSYELVNEPDVSIALKNAEGKLFNYTFSKFNKAYKLNIGFLPPGEYTYEAKVSLDNSLQVKKGILMVKPVVSEKIHTVADHNLLNQLSKNTGGKLFYPNQLQFIKNELNKNELIKPITYSQNETTELIDLKLLFFVILAFLGIEWFIRKYYGMV